MFLQEFKSRLCHILHENSYFLKIPLHTGLFPFDLTQYIIQIKWQYCILGEKKICFTGIVKPIESIPFSTTIMHQNIFIVLYNDYNL